MRNCEVFGLINYRLRLPYKDYFRKLEVVRVKSLVGTASLRQSQNSIWTTISVPEKDLAPDLNTLPFLSICLNAEMDFEYVE